MDLKVVTIRTEESNNNNSEGGASCWFLRDESCSNTNSPIMMTTLQEQGNDAQETLTPTHHTNYTHSILLYVNGVKHQLSCPNPELTLSQYLRNELRLTGTKIGCNEGGCGSCVVMIQHFDHGKQRVVSRSVNSCLFPLIECDGCHVVTVEGVGSSRDDMLHLIQRRIREFNGSQVSRLLLVLIGAIQNMHLFFVGYILDRTK